MCAWPSAEHRWITQSGPQTGRATEMSKPLAPASCTHGSRQVVYPLGELGRDELLNNREEFSNPERFGTAGGRICGNSSRAPQSASSPMPRPSRGSTSVRPRHRRAGACTACADTGPHTPLCAGIWDDRNPATPRYLHRVWPKRPATALRGLHRAWWEGDAVEIRDRDTAPAPPGVARYPVQG